MNFSTQMRRTIAAFLLICLGILHPLAASPVRLCLLEHRLLTSCAGEKSPCCPDCDPHHEEDSCCVELDHLPDAPVPGLPQDLPAVTETDLPPALLPTPPLLSAEHIPFSAANPIRGPDSPAARRALLEVWTL